MLQASCRECGVCKKFLISIINCWIIERQEIKKRAQEVVVFVTDARKTFSYLVLMRYFQICNIKLVLIIVLSLERMFNM